MAAVLSPSARAILAALTCQLAAIDPVLVAAGDQRLEITVYLDRGRVVRKPRVTVG